MSGPGLGIARGIEKTAQGFLRMAEQSKARRDAESENLKKVKADELMNQIHSVAGNAQEVLRNANGNEQDPAYLKLATTGKTLIQQYRQLFGDKPQEAVEHLKNFKPKQYQKLQERTAGLPTWEGEAAAAPQAPALKEDWKPQGDPYQVGGASGPYYQAFVNSLGKAQATRMPEGWTPGVQPEEWRDQGEPFTFEGKNYQRQVNKDGTQHRAMPIEGPLPEKPKKPLDIKNNAATGGLEALEDPNTGMTYHAGNIANAPPEVKQQWDSIVAQQKQQGQLKETEEDKRTQAAFDRQDRALQLALQRQDYAQASKTVKAADDEYQASIDRAATMDQNLTNALSGDQQAMLSLVANHIGMTLGAQKGARINRAVWDEAVQSAPVLAKLAAKFDERGWLSGVTLAPEQMRQMVSLAHEKVEILRAHKDRVQEEYSDALGAKKPTPAEIKKKAQGTITSPIDDEIMGAIKKIKG